LLLPWRVVWVTLYWLCYLLYRCAYVVQRFAKTMGNIG
jgi:hypothetical protein